MDSSPVRQLEGLNNVRDIARATRSRGRIASWYSQGKIGWIFLWLLGVPIPILLGLFLLRGCT